MSKVHTHYDNLKVARDAPPEVIRAAYKTLCHKFHPDRHGGSERATQTFQLINTAYEVLSDPERRRQHDEWIARTESRRLPPPKASEKSRPWNGKERRRRAWSVGSGASASVDVGGRLKRSGTALVLWASAVVVGMMLLMLYHA